MTAALQYDLVEKALDDALPDAKVVEDLGDVLFTEMEGRVCLEGDAESMTVPSRR